MEQIKKALLIEDDLLCQKIMTHYLLELDYQIDLFDNGIIASQHIHRKIYDLILLDIRLDGISGRKVIRNIRDSNLNAVTPLIIWSAFVDKNNEEKYLLWGADAALIKACRVKELKKTIKKMSLKSKNI